MDSLENFTFMAVMGVPDFVKPAWEGGYKFALLGFPVDIIVM
jgi:hypothetical protein